LSKDIRSRTKDGCLKPRDRDGETDGGRGMKNELLWLVMFRLRQM